MLPNKEENKMSNSFFKPAVLVEDSNGIHQINSKEAGMRPLGEENLPPKVHSAIF